MGHVVFLLYALPDGAECLYSWTGESFQHQSQAYGQCKRHQNRKHNGAGAEPFHGTLEAKASPAALKGFFSDHSSWEEIRFHAFPPEEGNGVGGTARKLHLLNTTSAPSLALLRKLVLRCAPKVNKGLSWQENLEISHVQQLHLTSF